MRPAPHRRSAAQLALPARPPHRRVCPDSEPGDRLRRSPRGFRMPAEWEPHEATWIAWPHNRDDWPGRFAPIPWVYAEIVRKLSRVEKVRILVQNAAVEKQGRQVLGKAGAPAEMVGFFGCTTDRVWTGERWPLFVRGRGGEV